MATTNRIYILATFLVSSIALIFNIVSLSTEQWITGKLSDLTDTTQDFSYINYGLFRGNYRRYVSIRASYQVEMTCNFANNVCALLCSADSTADLLDALYNNNINENDDPTGSCISTTSSVFAIHPLTAKTLTTTTYVNRKNFINAGVWLSTIVCLVIAAIIGLLASVLALYNTISNPINFYLSVGSLYFYNGLALGFTLLYVILWGTMYNLTIFHNVALYDTLAEKMTSDKMAFLGYSYWISFIPMTFYGASIAVLFYREHLNAKDPKQKNIQIEDSADPSLFLF
ncbi:clarin-3-like [Sitophilus oryzae]|uniref:Clarin-3-like n=1 Tax=Sitophilus oryzae TaxID=7048 RepID=A0A6J2XST7_SITOR|nr:clarin-3-like [Sitophilus oryzae]